MFTPRPGTQSSAFDLSGLASLKRDAQTQAAPKDTREEIARQFEALYIQMMLKRMREATPRDGLLDSDQTRMVQSMGDEQLALQLANPGVGLAQALERQMRRNEGEAENGSEAIHTFTTDGLPTGRQAAVLNGGDQVAPADAMESVGALLQLLERQASFSSTGQKTVGGAGTLAPSDHAPEHVAGFVEKLGAAAEAAAADSGVPARLILSQAALESGWGKREIKFADGSTSHNLFGIKAGSSWKGKVVHVLTTEYIDGEPQKMLQPFRAYDSYEASFRDYARLVGNSPRYAAVTQTNSDVEAARLIQEAGYATDPRYAEKLISIMDLMRGKPALPLLQAQR